ncbi:unnamed protein product [Cuscuta epithymum]|uniref:Uncharacterized protein n=1 Tax=Cuscuta epithymum TaxID=186058 RepID=A0AAV0C6Y9_9ASTE|nr:unnamed protein product [Cuscuta epithymum]
MEARLDNLRWSHQQNMELMAAILARLDAEDRSKRRSHALRRSQEPQKKSRTVSHHKSAKYPEIAIDQEWSRRRSHASDTSQHKSRTSSQKESRTISSSSPSEISSHPSQSRIFSQQSQSLTKSRNSQTYSIEINSSTIKTRGEYSTSTANSSGPLALTQAEVSSSQVSLILESHSSSTLAIASEKGSPGTTQTTINTELEPVVPSVKETEPEEEDNDKSSVHLGPEAGAIARSLTCDNLSSWNNNSKDWNSLRGSELPSSSKIGTKELGLMYLVKKELILYSRPQCCLVPGLLHTSKDYANLKIVWIFPLFVSRNQVKMDSPFEEQALAERFWWNMPMGVVWRNDVRYTRSAAEDGIVLLKSIMKVNHNSMGEKSNVVETMGRSRISDKQIKVDVQDMNTNSATVVLEFVLEYQWGRIYADLDSIIQAASIMITQNEQVRDLSVKLEIVNGMQAEVIAQPYKMVFCFKDSEVNCSSCGILTEYKIVDIVGNIKMEPYLFGSRKLEANPVREARRIQECFYRGLFIFENKRNSFIFEKYFDAKGTEARKSEGRIYITEEVVSDIIQITKLFSTKSIIGSSCNYR